MQIDLNNLTFEEMRALKNPTAADAAWQKIAAGIHPLGPRIKKPVGEFRCGGCKWAYPIDEFEKRIWKCWEHKSTGGQKTDLRLSWPACEKFGHKPEIKK